MSCFFAIYFGFYKVFLIIFNVFKSFSLKIPFIWFIKINLKCFWETNALFKSFAGIQNEQYCLWWSSFFTFFVRLKKWKRSLSIHLDTLIMLSKSGLSPILFSILSRLLKTIHHEKKPNGVFFKLFLVSLNLKRLSSKVVFFMLVKVLEDSSFWW